MSTSALKKNYHHGDLRDALLMAALAILEESGDIEALTLRETARRAGVSAMAPYRHFSDKHALIAGVAAIGFERFAAALHTADAAPDPHEALIAQGVAYVAFAIENKALFRLMFGADAPASKNADCAHHDAAHHDLAHRDLAHRDLAHRDLAKISGAGYSVLADRVASLVPPSRAADQTLACWAMAHGLACLALDGKLSKYSEQPTALADRALRGLTL